MRFHAHVTAGAAAMSAAFATGLIEPDGITVAAVSAFIGTMAPDLDHTESKLGRRLLPVSWLLSLVSGHAGGKRGAVTHSLAASLFWTALYGILAAGFLHALDRSNPVLPWQSGIGVWWTANSDAVVGFLVGFLSHLCADCLTKGGTPLLWPLPKRVALTGMKTGGTGEFFACIGFVAVAALIPVLAP